MRPVATKVCATENSWRLTKAGIELNRKVISSFPAIHEPDSFKKLVAKAKAALEASAARFLFGVENDLRHCRSNGDDSGIRKFPFGVGAGESIDFRTQRGVLTQAAKNMGSLAKEDRPAFGQALNQATADRGTFKNSLEGIEEQADLRSLGEKIDPTLPRSLTVAAEQHPDQRSLETDRLDF